MTARARFAIPVVAGGALVALAVGGAALGLSRAAATVEGLRGEVGYRPEGATRTRVTGLAAGHLTRLDAVPESLLIGLLFNEDKRFFDHGGFDVGEMAISLREWLAGERGLRGASTLTQQLARTVFLSSARTLGRKLREALYTFALERHFTKDEILALYLDTVEWGPDVHGIAEASEHYFGRAPAGLRPEECAFLIAILPSPRRLVAQFAQRRGTPLRVQRVLDALARADAARTGALTDADDPVARLVPAVAGARERASARRAAS